MKAHGEKSDLELLVQTRPEETVELEGELGHVKMIPFSGTVSGELFQGVIEPCGVDTQVTDAAGVRHMSARYMLTGTDCTGQSCRIYVENDGWFTNGERPKPWHSVPRFRTDSAALAPILHRGQWRGDDQKLFEFASAVWYNCPSNSQIQLKQDRRGRGQALSAERGGGRRGDGRRGPRTGVLVVAAYPGL